MECVLFRPRIRRPKFASCSIYTHFIALNMAWFVRFSFFYYSLDDLLWIVTTHADGVFGVWALENLAFRGQGAVRPILLRSLVRLTIFCCFACVTRFLLLEQMFK